MRRGFKAYAEKKSLELRTALNLSKKDYLPARILAKHLNLIIKSSTEIPGINNNLSKIINDPDNGFSAITIYLDPFPLIILNDSHSVYRQESDLMHEIAHIIEGHTPFGFNKLGPFNCRTYNKGHEDEARWLGGCLQICREGILWAVKKGMSNENISHHFNASLEMVRYRRNVTGIDYQISKLKNKTFDNDAF